MCEMCEKHDKTVRLEVREVCDDFLCDCHTELKCVVREVPKDVINSFKEWLKGREKDIELEMEDLGELEDVINYFIKCNNVIC